MASAAKSICALWVVAAPEYDKALRANGEECGIIQLFDQLKSEHIAVELDLTLEVVGDQNDRMKAARTSSGRTI